MRYATLDLTQRYATLDLTQRYATLDLTQLLAAAPSARERLQQLTHMQLAAVDVVSRAASSDAAYSVLGAIKGGK
jgi:hypothetical protein